MLLAVVVVAASSLGSVLLNFGMHAPANPTCGRSTPAPSAPIPRRGLTGRAAPRSAHRTCSGVVQLYEAAGVDECCS